MNNTLQKIPFLRPTIALALGILLASQLQFPELVLISSCIVILALTIILNLNYKFNFTSIFGSTVQLLFLFIGILVYQNYNQLPSFLNKGYFVGTVLEKPQEKENSFKSIFHLSHIVQKDSISNSNEKVIVYFEKDTKVKGLQAGDVIIFKSKPSFIKNYGNPFEFDYKSYLENKRIYRQVYLSTKNWKLSENKSSSSLKILAENLRENLLSIYRQQNLGENELEILSALTLGYKRDLDPETKRVFSAAGAMHVLAVSGLHVGIIFWVISLLFGVLKKRKSGRFLFVILSIILLWSYALITGLSPSVSRAALMFSIFVIGDNLNRKASTYNSLAASALFLLLVNPNNLFEVGFQLSYSAVFGIVFLQPKLAEFIPVKNKILNFFWSLLTVSIAAQIATFPLSIYYFNQFPTYFWITNLFIIPIVMILIPLGISLLILLKIPILSYLVSTIVQFLIKGGYFLLSGIEKIPYSTFSISIHWIEMLMITAILISVFLLSSRFNSGFLITTLFFVLLLVSTSLFLNINHYSNREIIVYDSIQNQTVQLIAGNKNYIISEKTINPRDKVFKQVQQTTKMLKLNSPQFIRFSHFFSDSFIIVKNGNIFFEGKKVLFQQNNKYYQKKYDPDIMIINFMQIKDLEISMLENTKIITNKRFIQKKHSLSPAVHYLTKQGAFREKW